MKDVDKILEELRDIYNVLVDIREELRK